MGSDRPDGALGKIDGALLRVRRLWTSSIFTDRLRAAVPADVELSSVFVVEAIGRDSDETTVGRLSELLGVEASTASRLAGTALAAGLVARGPSEVDLRRTVLTLTPVGDRLLATAREFRLDLLRELTDGWDDAERTVFAELLWRFATAVTDARAVGPLPTTTTPETE